MTAVLCLIPVLVILYLLWVRFAMGKRADQWGQAKTRQYLEEK